MTTYVLVHGGAHGGWCWDHVVAGLAALGHAAVAPDLPVDVPGAGAELWVDVLSESFEGAGDDTVAVGHSTGGLVLPVLASRRPLRRMVFIGAAIPTPQEPIAGLFASAPEAITIPLLAQAIDDTGRFKFSWETARDFFYHDIPEEEAKAAWSRLRPQDPTIFTEPCPIAAWPSVPSTYVAMTDDRAMNPAWWSRLAVERLGADVVELPGSHSPFLSRPAELIKILASV